MTWNTTKIRQKIQTENIYHKAFWSWFSRFLFPPLTLYYNSLKGFPELIRPIFLFMDDFVLSLWSLNGIFCHIEFLRICNESESFLGFLNVFLNVLNQTLGLLEHLYICTKASSKSCPLFEIWPPSVFLQQKSKTLFLHSQKK